MCELLSPEGPCWARGFLFLATGLLLLSYLAYLVLGTGVFWALEGSVGVGVARDMGVRMSWGAGAQSPLPRSFWSLHHLPQDIIQAYKDGTYLLDNTTSMGRWEFVGSFFFSVSTITTIGYGNLSPETMAARLFCILFALIGIPLNLVVLNRLGHLMQRGVHRCVQQLGGSWQDPARARWLAGSAALLSGLLLFLLLPPLLFSHMEGWSYVESFYFAFITLSTVGFGDYVIGMDPSRKYPLWYKNIVSLWILFGMAWLALIIKMILSLLEMPGDMCTCSLHCSKGDIQGRSWSQGQEGEHRVQSPGVTSGTFHSGYAI
ncbi:Potassium channel subfamily K member 17 [Cricetulus griseus]|uniref:Potassium channel subfamily K member n=1 Tax=Cricetulus griseus TaxID=10029 RepID=G3H9Y0_CRIGR|nr:Potassium channel subfamily K member 17 [Cricetulus griseus]